MMRVCDVGGHVVAVGTTTGMVFIVNVKKHAIVSSIKAGDGPVYGLSIAPDGQSIVTFVVVGKCFFCF